MKIVVAVDKFKGSLTAAEAANALTEGLTADRDDLHVVSVPVADGGDGTLHAALAAGFDAVPVRVAGPTGEPVQAQIAVKNGTAVVELAATCGLELLPDGRRQPLTASSEGAGQAIAAAIDAGAKTVVLGLGGSASTDGGAGILRALGARILDSSGGPVGPGGGGLLDVATVDLRPALERMRGVELVIASDVDNALTGRFGAAAVYGPQKGATPEQVAQLDHALDRFARTVAQSSAGSTSEAGEDLDRRPGAGAAGGAGYAAYLLGGTFRPGIEIVLELVDIDAELHDADLVITGEGTLDEQSLRGKAPVGVAIVAARHNVPVVAVAGQVTIYPEHLHQAGIRRAYALTDLTDDVQECISQAAPLLRQLAQQVIAIQEAGPAGL